MVLVHFLSLKISSSDIGAAVAEAMLHDIRVNLLGINGFPQIKVERSLNEGFDVSLCWGKDKTSFTLSDDEAVDAVKVMKEQKTYYPPIFDRVQEALAGLEAMPR
ncbi:hypothetical protein ACSSV1_006165 [Labrenzia sp. MBR-25]|jgi:hypothetical protein